MTFWQAAFAIWALGAFAAFPAVFELYAGEEERSDQPSPAWFAIGISVIAAALWMTAWLQLIRFTLRKAAGHD